MERKLSAIFIQMASTILANPATPPSHEAAAVALYLTNVAWMRVLGVESLAAGDETFLSRMGQENRSLWRELKSRNVEALIKDLMAYKLAHHSDDRRHVTFCGVSEQKVRVEWTDPPAA